MLAILDVRMIGWMEVLCSKHSPRCPAYIICQRVVFSWVALRDVCGEYKNSVLETRKELHDYMRENPTIEQSRRNIRHLAHQAHLGIPAVLRFSLQSTD